MTQQLIRFVRRRMCATYIHTYIHTHTLLVSRKRLADRVLRLLLLFSLLSDSLRSSEFIFPYCLYDGLLRFVYSLFDSSAIYYILFLFVTPHCVFGGVFWMNEKIKQIQQVTTENNGYTKQQQQKNCASIGFYSSCNFISTHTHTHLHRSTTYFQRVFNRKNERAKENIRKQRP